MPSNIYETLMGINIYSIFFRLLLAVLFSGLIGLDRGSKRRPAGMRTYILVCVGSTLAMITNQFIAERYGTADPSRIGAQVISGIGFLGAGTIIVTRERQVKGLTTAAGLWANACMGLALGIGFYEGAIIGMLFIFIVMTVLHQLDNKLMSASKVVDMYIELEEDYRLSHLLEYVRNEEMRVSSLEVVESRGKSKEGIAALITLRLPKRMAHYDIVAALSGLEGVAFAEEV